MQTKGSIKRTRRGVFAVAEVLPRRLLGIRDTATAQPKVLVACLGWVRTGISINAFDTHGQPNNTQDLTTENGISGDDCAEQIVRAMEKTKTK